MPARFPAPRRSGARGEASGTATRLAAHAALVALALGVGAGRARGQSVRTEDVGLSIIRFGYHQPVLAALTLDEGLAVERERSSTNANGTLSLYQDGRWSAQGSLLGTRFSPVVATAGPLASWFRSIRGEFGASTAATLQQRGMPTFEVLSTARAHLLDLDRGLWGGASVARSFDGEIWRTTIIGEAAGWLRRGTTVATGVFRPMQTTGGDLLGDSEGSLQWVGGNVTWQATAGIRLGQAQRITVGWGALSGSFLWRQRFLVTASIGAFPEDLLQGLPSGHYLGISVRLPSRARFAATPAPPAATPRDSRPVDPAGLPDAWSAAVVAHFETPDSGSTLRFVRVRAPGAQRVELLGEFTNWQPVRLVRGRLGEWETTIRIRGGVHRFNIRIDGVRLVVPANVGRVTDEFGGTVGIMIVPD